MVVEDTGWKTPGTVSGSEFTDSDNIKIDDSTDATFTSTGGMVNGMFAKTLCNSATNFSFSIPSDATITGLEVRVKAKKSGDTFGPIGRTNSWNSKQVGGTTLTTNGFIYVNSDATTSYDYYTAGSDTELWTLNNKGGASTPLSPSIINDSSFGVKIVSAYENFTVATFSVDVVEMKVYYEVTIKSTVIDETIDLIINNSYYGLGVESGLLDSFMNNSIKMIELQADNSLTPTSSENLKIDTFSDSTGYLNTVSSATATFDTNKYKRVTAIDETITLNISGVTGNKTACQLYINQIDNEEDCEITYDIISSSSEEELDIPINEYHVIEAFNPTTSKLNGGYIKIHLKNNAAVPTSGYPSIKTYALKLW